MSETVKLKLDKSVYYVDEPIICTGVFKCATIGLEFQYANLYLSQDKVNWTNIYNFVENRLCGLDCILGCEYETIITVITIAEPGTWYIAIEGPNLPPPGDPAFPNCLQCVTPITISTNLPTGYGNVVVSSSPPGADIYVDGVKWGARTPASVIARTGSRKMKLKLDGYQDYDTPVLIEEGRAIQLQHTFIACDIPCRIVQFVEDNQIILVGVGVGLVGCAALFYAFGPVQRPQKIRIEKKIETVEPKRGVKK